MCLASSWKYRANTYFSSMLTHVVRSRANLHLGDVSESRSIFDSSLLISLLSEGFGGEGDMANLVVRNIDESVVKALKARAGLAGISAEAEHRKILEAALLGPQKRSLAEVLQDIPAVGEDADFERQ